MLVLMPNTDEPVVAYEDRLVAFLDILGWSDLIRRSATDDVVLAQMALSMTAIKKMEALARQQFTGVSSSWQVSQFSDTLVVSTAAQPLSAIILAFYLGTVCQTMLENGHYVRGAIVRGKVFHRESVLYGPALLEAYRIETEVAKYPRIVLTPQAMSLMQRSTEPLADLLETGGQHPFFAVDADGLHYLDFLCHLGRESTIHQARAWVEQQRDRDRENLNLYAKHSWMLSYLDRVGPTVSQRYDKDSRLRLVDLLFTASDDKRGPLDEAAPWVKAHAKEALDKLMSSMLHKAGALVADEP
jgi:hypothetical protein